MSEDVIANFRQVILFSMTLFKITHYLQKRMDFRTFDTKVVKDLVLQYDPNYLYDVRANND